MSASGHKRETGFRLVCYEKKKNRNLDKIYQTTNSSIGQQEGKDCDP